MTQQSDRAGSWPAWLLAVSAALSVGGCEDYLYRRDTLTLQAGDAVEVNKATQTINRWPPEARRDRWESDGERAQIAVEKYRTRAIPNPLKEATTSSSTTKSGP